MTPPENKGPATAPVPAKADEPDAEQVEEAERPVLRLVSPPPPKPAPEQFNLTDLGNAKRLVAHYGEAVRYVPPWKKWLIWQGQRWCIDQTGDIHRAAKWTVKRIYAEAAAADTSDESRALANHAKNSEAASRIAAMIEVAKTEPDIPVMPDQLDTDPYLLNVQNGTLDLRTGELRPHQREDLITKLMPVEYDSEAQCPLFMEFLARISNGDQELQDFIQRAFGYSLTGDTSEQVLFIPYGTGANGKTTLLNVIQDLLGDYALQTPTDTFVRRRERSATNDLARLRGSRFVVATEVDQDGKLDEVMVKQVTGGDTISARMLYREFFDFRPECKIFLVTNHKPLIRGSDEGIWRRVLVIPFEVRIPEEERDKHLPKKLRQEFPGILAWAVRGCLDWQKNGLEPPGRVTSSTEEYRAEMDWMSAFLKECCVRKETANTKASELHAALIKWWPLDDEGIPTKKEFSQRLGTAGFRSFKKSGFMWWSGIALQSEDH
jgi:putative DNA primase/helicase